MEIVSKNLVFDRDQRLPTYEAHYKTPKEADLTDLFLFTHGQPHDLFHQMRTQAPVSWIPIPIEGYQGFWALTRYEDIKYVDLNPQLFSSQKGGIHMAMGSPQNWIDARLQGAAINNMICLDQPFHIPLRMHHRPFFTPDYVETLRARVAKEVDRLLDNMEKMGGHINMVEHFSEKLPLFTLCEMLGVEEKDRPKIARWMHYLELAQYALGDPSRKINKWFFVKFLWNVQQMLRYGARVMRDRRKNPRDDLLTCIAQAELNHEPMSQEYLDGAWLLIIFAGNDTTRNSLSGTMRLLEQFPEQKQMLLDDPSLITKMVPEALRLVSPVMHMRRTAMEDVEISGQKIAAGEKVIMWFGAANRDPSVFANPDQMDIHRENVDQHLAFGIGPHVCLGKRIAIMQLETAYTHILERFPNIRWTGVQEHAPNNFVHAISKLEVDLGTG